jgi:YHS domain-containing protein
MDNQDLTQPTPALPPEYKTACGGKLTDPSKYPSAMYRGERIYFCTRACLRVFEQDPDPFMAGEVEHPIEED